MNRWVMECLLAGESFQNADGTDRQAEIAVCRVGEPVALRWDRENEHDPSAVAVHSIRGRQIGFLRKGENAEFLSYHSEGLTVDATISAIYGGSSDKPQRGVVIDIELDDDGTLDAGGTDDDASFVWMGTQGFWLLTQP